MSHASDVPVHLRTPYREVRFGIAKGGRLPLDLRHAARMWLGVYELEIAAHVRRLAPRGAVSYDVGSGLGYYAIALSGLTGAKVCAFDSDADACAQLERTAQRNARAIEVTHVKVGERSGPGVVSLDDHVARTGLVPAFVKADIEGAEAEMLRGARKLLAAHRPAWVIETHGSRVEKECVELLRAADYDVRPIDQRRWLRESRPDPENRWIVAVPLPQKTG